MRQVRVFIIVSLFCFGACHNVENNASDVRSFIPGTYVKEVKNEYTIAYDTLFIQCTGGNNFLIVNRTSFQPIRNGRLMALKHSEVNMKALYDEASRNLNEQKLGKTFSFDPANNKLFEGASPYNKIQL